jgi:hypothetical protein
VRQPVLEAMQRREEASIRDFVEIWYSEATGPSWRRSRSVPDHAVGREGQSVSQNA